MSSPEASMRIGELSRATGVSVRSLRYYEERGLLVSARSSGGQRHYPPSAVDRVLRIQELYAAGLSSTIIADVLPCLRDTDGGPNEHTTPALAEALRAERRRLDRQIAAMEQAREVLDEVIDAAAGPPDAD